MYGVGSFVWFGAILPLDWAIAPKDVRAAIAIPKNKIFAFMNFSVVTG
ncbi:hypothetical protein CES86_1362 [Brucella lupini]|uniref:Uncharacterized protein n=1 Tax=Brucella lupini TaxID=255457 RepID=A0A256GWP1_9HYPH|nr:hypothetical protein CES86_1362 [Brucella lupini]